MRREIEGPWALPSVQLETPDPNAGKDQTGERLVVHWSIPQHIKFAQLMVKVRLSDATVEHFSFPLAKSWGHWIHRWNGSTNAEKLPIVAYCAEVWSRDRLIAAKVHPLWMEPASPARKPAEKDRKAMTELVEKKFPMPMGKKGQSLPIVARQLTQLAPPPTWRVDIRDQIEISAQTPSQIYSLASCLELAASVGHLEDFSGDATPLIERRWLQCSIDLLDEVKDLSANERRAHFESWCLTALQLGYNGLFLGEGFDYNKRWPFKVSSFQVLASQLGSVARLCGLCFGLDITRWGTEHKSYLPELILESRAR